MKIKLLVIASLFVQLGIKAQLVTSNSLTPTQLVQQVLLGTGVTASNITYNGSPLQIAQFSATSSTGLGFLQGVIMSTGNALTSNINGPQGPNTSPGTTTSFFNSGDTDLSALAGLTTNDAAVLEFDFIPTSDSVRFRYFFGSEEYPEFVNDVFNDVFGFFISGPNPSGGNYTNKNIALIPNTVTPVSINNVNSGLNSSYFIDNTGNVINVEFDGLTVVLKALEKVVCGQTYHIKLAIADGGDTSFDSGVFLEAGSFSSKPPITVTTSNSNSLFTDSIMVEGCNANCVYFVRYGNIAQKDSFQLALSGNALLGADYVMNGNPTFVWPNKIVFAANQDSIAFCNLIAIEDNIVEGKDTIKLTITSYTNGASACTITSPISFNLFTQDYAPITIGQSDLTICANQTVQLSANAALGVPAYTYTWMPSGATTSTINVGPFSATTNYTIQVNDICNKTVTKIITITSIPIPILSASNETLCVGSGNTVTLTVSGANTYTWSNSVNTTSIVVTPTTTTSYTVIGSDGVCNDTTTVLVSVIGENVSITGLNSMCVGNNATLTANTGGGTGSFAWSNSLTTNTINVNPNTTTTYSVLVSIGACTNFAVHTLSVIPNPTVSISSLVFCAGASGSLIATGATTYTWSTGNAGNTIVVTPTGNITYSVTGTTQGCSNTAVHTVTVIPDNLNLIAIADLKFCLDSLKNIALTIQGGNPPFNIGLIIPTNGIMPVNVTNNTYSFLQTEIPTQGVYQFYVTDQCAYKDTTSTMLTIVDCKVIVPNVITPNGDGKNEFFKINGLDNFPNSSLYVYNRWGKKVYESANYKNDWQPEQTDGTYFYVLEVSDGRKLNGFFHLYK